jgi:hypothetical protein
MADGRLCHVQLFRSTGEAEMSCRSLESAKPVQGWQGTSHDSLSITFSNLMQQKSSFVTSGAQR